MRTSAVAHLGGLWASEPDVITGDLDDLRSGGRWAVVLPYRGEPVLVRFTRWSVNPPSEPVGPWGGVAPEGWRTSLSEDDYVEAVRRVQGTSVAARSTRRTCAGCCPLRWIQAMTSSPCTRCSLEATPPRSSR